MEPETVSVRTATEAGDPAVRRRRLAVAGVSLMGAAAVSTAVFQTVTGTSTSLAMPDLASVLAGTASFPTPQGPAASAGAVSAPAITDLGVPTSTAADPTTPQVDLRANRGPLPDPAARPAPAASPLAGAAPARPSTADAPSSTPTGSGPARPRSDDGRDHGDGRHGGRGGSSGPTRPGSTTPGTTPPASTTPGTTTPGTTTPGTTTPGTTPPASTTPAPTSPPGSTSPSQPSTPSTQAPPPSSAPASGA